jgi:putative ABC transport system permease protein
MKVIGVIKDYHYASLREEIAPLLLTQDPNYSQGTLYVKLDDREVPGTIKAVEKIFRKHVPFQPFNYKFEEDSNRKKYEREAKWKQMITYAAFITIFISCIGLFGLATFNTESRVKEIGIRKILGASISAVVLILSADFVKLVLMAIVLAWPISNYAVTLWLNDFAYRIDMQWWYFGLAGVMVMGIALLTVSFQAFKAAVANPVESLQSD